VLAASPVLVVGGVGAAWVTCKAGCMHLRPSLEALAICSFRLDSQHCTGIRLVILPTLEISLIDGLPRHRMFVFTAFLCPRIWALESVRIGQPGTCLGIAPPPSRVTLLTELCTSTCHKGGKCQRPQPPHSSSRIKLHHKHALKLILSNLFIRRA
jgi:hypothetical protein